MFLKSSVSLKQEIKCDKIIDLLEFYIRQWNIDTYGKSNVTLPLPTNKHQKIVHLVDYLAAQKGVEVMFDGFTPENNNNNNNNSENIKTNATFDTYVFTFGKYKGMKLTEVNEKHPDYIEWAKKTIDHEPLKSFLTQL